MYEARGGEIIQRIPSVIRVYDIVHGKMISVIRIQNEKPVTCSNEVIVTVSNNLDFTNVYNLKTGDPIMTLEMKADIAMFYPTSKHLLMVTRELTHSLRVHSGGNFLDNQKIRVCKRDSDSIINVKVCSRESKLVVACVRRSADVLYGVEAGIEYVLVDIESKESLCKFEPKAELIHISANGNVAVDRDFTFYSLRTGDLLFQFKENVSLAGFLSYFTDDGEIFLYLNTDKGTLNAIDVGRKKLISSCMYCQRRRASRKRASEADGVGIWSS